MFTKSVYIFFYLITHVKEELGGYNMNDEEILEYVNHKFKNCKNKIRSVKEHFPKEPKEINFEEVFYLIMKDYIKENN